MLLHRQAVIEKIRGRTVAERGGTAALAGSTDAVGTTSGNMADRAPGFRPDPGIQRQEQFSFHFTQASASLDECSPGVLLQALESEAQARVHSLDE